MWIACLVAIALLCGDVTGWGGQKPVGQIGLAGEGSIEFGSVLVSKPVFVINFARKEDRFFGISEFLMQSGETADKIAINRGLMGWRYISTINGSCFGKLNNPIIAPIPTDLDQRADCDVFRRSLSKVSNRKPSLGCIVQMKLTCEVWLCDNTHELLQYVDVRPELTRGCFKSDLIGIPGPPGRLAHRRSCPFSNVELVGVSLRLFKCVLPSFGGCIPGLLQCSIVGIGAVSRGVSSSFCIESGIDGCSNGYGGETYANATHNKLAQGVGLLGLRNEIRALRDAVRLTTNSKAFPVAAREAFLASMAGIFSGVLAVGIPLWITFGWRRRNQSKGRN